MEGKPKLIKKDQIKKEEKKEEKKTEASARKALVKLTEERNAFQIRKTKNNPHTDFAALFINPNDQSNNS